MHRHHRYRTFCGVKLNKTGDIYIKRDIRYTVRWKNLESGLEIEQILLTPRHLGFSNNMVEIQALPMAQFEDVKK